MIPKNNAPREYEKVIDFSREHPNWGIRGIVMTHIDKEHLTNFLAKLISMEVLRDWEMSIRPLFTFSQACIVFEPRSCIERHIDTSLKHLLQSIELFKGKITYKEGEFGYHIEPNGEILSKWPLDDGMC